MRVTAPTFHTSPNKNPDHPKIPKYVRSRALAAIGGVRVAVMLEDMAIAADAAVVRAKLDGCGVAEAEMAATAATAAWLKHKAEVIAMMDSW